VTLSFCLKLRV